MTTARYKKIVLWPIEVSPGKYCWEWFGNRAICGHFNNEGGHATCNLGMYISTKDETSDVNGILKPSECLNLHELKE